MRGLRWSIKALLDFDEAQSYISHENPLAAAQVAERIWRANLMLPANPELGRPGQRHGTREWVVQRTPYLIVYRVTDTDIEILRIWHGRRDWVRTTD